MKIGPEYGYQLNAAKTCILVKEEYLAQGRGGSKGVHGVL